MAITSSSAVFEIRNNGNVNNGGGFVPGSGTDGSQSDTPIATYTDLVLATTTTLTSVARPFVSTDVGNVINITSGTGFTTGRYEIASVASGTATLNQAAGTGGSTGGNARLGGAMTLTQANLQSMIAGNKAWVKKDATYNPAALAPSNSGTTALAIELEGYNTARGDAFSNGALNESNRPLIACGANSFTLLNYWIVKGIEYTGSVAAGLRIGLGSALIGVKTDSTSSVYGCSTDNNNARFLFCDFKCSTGSAWGIAGGSTGALLYECYLHDSVNGALVNQGNQIFIKNIFDTCSTAGLNIGANNTIIDVGNTFYSCGKAISATTSNGCTNIENIINSCTTGLDWSSGRQGSNIMIANNYNGNTTNVTNSADSNATDSSTAPSFANGPGGNFLPSGSLSPFPSSFAGGLTTKYAIPGAAQKQAGGGGGFAMTRARLPSGVTALG